MHHAADSVGRASDDAARDFEPRVGGRLHHVHVGSTGVPKGVVVPAAQLATTLQQARQSLALNASDVVAVLSPCVVDFSLLEMVTPWTAGAASRIIGRADTLDLDALLDQLQGVTILHAVPQLMDQVAAAVIQKRSPASPRALRLLWRRTVPPAVIRRMQQAFTGADVAVNYVRPRPPSSPPKRPSSGTPRSASLRWDGRLGRRAWTCSMALCGGCGGPRRRAVCGW